MEFRYGISEQSLARWIVFEGICAIQEERGEHVGRAMMSQIVDRELEAIERATEEHERCALERPKKVLTRSSILPAK